MTLTLETLSNASDTLRTWALDERMKATVMSNPVLASAAAKIAHRYTAGSELEDALRILTTNQSCGHLGSIECVGESVRDRAIAIRETDKLRTLISRLTTTSEIATISFDLSHIGSIISADLGLENALQIAQAARDAGTYIMISAEGSTRTDLVLDIWEKISVDFPETGITLQARLRRTPSDLEGVVTRSGPVRVVKGAFLEPEVVAYPRNSAAMYTAYKEITSRLVRAGHRVNIATHDARLVDDLRDELGADLREDHVGFETLQGLGTSLLDTLLKDGFTTREYIVYGPEWWLYVLNRIAEHPERALTALGDLTPKPSTSSEDKLFSMN